MHKRLLLLLIVVSAFLLLGSGVVVAQTSSSIEVSTTVTEEDLLEASGAANLDEPVDPRAADFTQSTEETLGPLEQLLQDQELGSVFPFNPVKYAIRNAVAAGVPVNTIVLLLLFPIIAAVIAAMRHLIGIRGFGIFLPAALSIVFLATGPVAGIFLFVVILSVATLGRMVLRKLKIQLQYLPRMALILWMVSLGVLAVLFMAPVLPDQLTTVSIFPILILVLLAESFVGVQLGKSENEAIALTMETLILALISFALLSLESLRRVALLQPEVVLVSVALVDWVIGRYVGLRLMEFWRYRKMIFD